MSDLWERGAPNDWREEDILITVRAYPEPSTTYAETSCVAGVTRQGVPVRLFPIPGRALDDSQRFSKYNVISARIRKATEDARPESHRVDLTSIKVIDHIGTGKKRDWLERDAWVEPFRQRQPIEALSASVLDVGSTHTPSLTLIRPRRVKRFQIRAKGQPDWTPKQAANLNQKGVLDAKDRMPLQFIPYDFLYHFDCEAEDCSGHVCRVLDWELQESYRQWRPKYGPARWEEKFLEKYEDEMMNRKDLQFFMGSISQHPQNFTIIGIYYPPKR